MRQSSLVAAPSRSMSSTDDLQTVDHCAIIRAVILFLLTKEVFSDTILSYHKNYILILDQVQRFCVQSLRCFIGNPV